MNKFLSSSCDSDKTIQYQYSRVHGVGISELWYTNHPTNLVLCNRCYNHLIKRHIHKNLCPPGIDYWSLHEWVRKNRPKPLVCEQCHINSPREVANIDRIYEKDISHFRWMCVSCHAKRDGRGHHHSPRKKRLSVMLHMRKRTFSLPDEVDVALKKRAADDDIRFSKVVETALREYLGLKNKTKEKSK
jgi:hypothetical protein